MAKSLETFPIHLGLGATAEPLPAFTGDMAWYETYARNHAQDGAEGRLVSQSRFTESWTSWEMHPAGHEIVIGVSGRMTVIQEHPNGEIVRVALEPGAYAINPPGVWHTADVDGEAVAIFITAGAGTENRPR